MKICHPDRNSYLMTSLFVCLFQSWTFKPAIIGFSRATHPEVCGASCVAVYVCIHMNNVIDRKVDMSFVYESQIANRGATKMGPLKQGENCLDFPKVVMYPLYPPS